MILFRSNFSQKLSAAKKIKTFCWHKSQTYNIVINIQMITCLLEGMVRNDMKYINNPQFWH